MIRISKRSDYAIAALTYIIGETEPVTAKKIAAKHHFSPMMLSKVLKVLAQGGIVKGTRGVSGGYKLQMNPEKITLGFILEVMDGPLQIIDCCSAIYECPARNTCKARYSLQKVQNKVYNLFESITLKELVKQKHIGEL